LVRHVFLKPTVVARFGAFILVNVVREEGEEGGGGGVGAKEKEETG
jgi:hypothetical protein